MYSRCAFVIALFCSVGFYVKACQRGWDFSTRYRDRSDSGDGSSDCKSDNRENKCDDNVNSSADGQGGGIRNSFITNGTLDYSDLNVSDISHTLRDQLKAYQDTEKVIHMMDSISRNLTLNKLDILLITDIMERNRNRPEVSRQVMMGVLALYGKVINTPEATLNFVQARANALNRFLRVVDEMTGKIQPGPSGTERVITDSTTSQVWDLTNPNVLNDNLPVGLLLSSNDNASGVKYLHNKSGDFSMTDAAILLPRMFILNLLNDTRDTDVRMSMTFYKDPLLFTKASATDAKYRLSSKVVVAAKIVVNGAEITDLDNEIVTMIFSKTEVDAGVPKTCGYWNFNLSGWSTDGCELSLGSSDHDVCTCDHLTNFAILLDLEGYADQSLVNSLPLTVITILGVSLSILGLSATLLSFMVFRKLREKRPQQTLFNLALAKLCAWVVFLVGIKQTQNHAGCTVVAILLHYFLLASFMWMLAEAFLHYLLLVKVQAQGTLTDRYMLKTGSLAWGLPLLPVLIILAVDPSLYRGSGSHCWMSLSASHYAFALPVGTVILLNIIMYIMVVVRVFRMSKSQTGLSKQNEKRELLKIRVPIICFILFGLTWIFGFLAVAESKVVFQYIFCLTSSLQGFFIFIFYTAGNEEVRQLWGRFCCREKKLIPVKRNEVPTSNMTSRTKGKMTSD